MRKPLRVTVLCCCFIAFARAGEPGTTSPVAVDVNEKHVDFLKNGQLVGRYHISADAPKPHFHPVIGPHGRPLTRGYPMDKEVPGETRDHPHHRAVWFCHGDVIPEGMELQHKVRGVEGVDFWAEGSNRGRIVCVGVEKPTSAGAGASIVTRNEWRTADGQKVMEETRGIRLMDLGAAQLFVFDIDLHASVAPITFGDTKEGSFGIRVAETMMERKGGVLENAEGKQKERECWGRKSAWCDYSGPVDGKMAGLTILDHPKNPYPAYWHSRGYGLMAANPFGRKQSGFPDARGQSDLVRLAKGERLRLRYGLLIHPGDAKEGNVAEHYQTFVRLP